jgi:hypothetical protein
VLFKRFSPVPDWPHSTNSPGTDARHKPHNKIAENAKRKHREWVTAHISPVVKMRLIINGTPIRIRQMGPDFLFVESDRDYPPGEATIVLQIDGAMTIS